MARFSPLYAVNRIIKPYGTLENHGGYGFAAAMESLRQFGHATMEYAAILAMAATDSLQPWNHCDQFGHATMEHGAMAAMDSLQPFWPWNRCGHFGHAVMELLLAMAAMDSLQPFWPCGHGIAAAILAMGSLQPIWPCSNSSLIS